METERLRRRIRYLLLLFMTALVVAGVTAIPLTWESALLNRLLGEGSTVSAVLPAFSGWVSFVDRGLQTVSREYPFISYGTDWLAFAHIVIAIAFWGPLRDPVKNLWVIEFGMIACGLIIPTALVFGTLRGIPILWLIIDCSFGVFGFLPLYMVHRYTRRLMALESETQLNRPIELLQART